MEQVGPARDKGLPLDLIISDLMDGLECLKRCSITPNRKIVLLLSAYNGKTRVDGALTAGAMDCIIHPALEAPGEKVDKIFDVKV